MASRRQGLQVFSSLFKIVRSELAAGGTGPSGAGATDAWLNVPGPLLSQQLISVKNFSTGSQATFAASAKDAKEAVSGVAKTVSKRKPRAAKEQGTDVVSKETKPRSRRTTSKDPAAGDKPQRTRSGQQVLEAGSTLESSVPAAAKPRSGRKPSKSAAADAFANASETLPSSMSKTPSGRKPASERGRSKNWVAKTDPAGPASAAPSTAKPRPDKKSLATRSSKGEPAGASTESVAPQSGTRTKSAISKGRNDKVAAASTEASSSTTAEPADASAAVVKSILARFSTSSEPAGSKGRSNKAAAASTEALPATTVESADAPIGVLKSIPAQSSSSRKPTSSKARSNKAAAASTEASPAITAEADPAAAADASSTTKRRSRRRVQQSTAAEATRASLSLPSYSQLKQNISEESGQLSAAEEGAIKDHMAAFQGSANVQDQALALYVNAKLFNTAIDELEDFLLQSVTPELAQTFVANSPGPAAEEALFGLFAEYVVRNYSKELQAYRTRVQSVDMRQSHLWYPVARALDRKIIYHAGPTNSGKTYNALQAMKAAKSGLYCGPLRLLAMEVYDSINQEGTLCNLYTGQERQELEGAKHASCTIEMINTTKHWECAVLDEIQMIGDDQRGWAWTRALQGLPANEIHLCGDASALPLVQQMCKSMGETLTVCNYDRFTQLEIEPKSLPNSYGSVQAGDAIVAFSRRDIFDIKTMIERRTNLKCCVIYGALPPEMRRHQAALFNDPDSGFDVLVASDAVGMGLNLNIRRVIFHKVQKFEGKESFPVSPSALKQIAGRAGRRNSIYPKGLVGTHNQGDLPRVIDAVNMPLSQLSTPAAGLFPEFQHLELLAGQVPNDSFGTLLERFSNEAKLEGTYFFCRQDGVMQVAKLLEKVDNLSLEDRFDFCMAPAQIRDSRQAAALLHFAARYANGMPVTLDINIPKVVPVTAEELRHMEATHQVMSLWIWLSHRFGSHAFPGLASVMEKSEGMIALMNQGLANMSKTNRGGGRRKNTAITNGFPKYNLNAALLQKQDPVALAYLADANNHKTIYNTEWLEPDEKRAQAVA